MATAHLIHGYLAVGKTTFAKRLAIETGAVYLGLDEWYLRLFADDGPTSHQDYAALDRLWSMLDDHWPLVLAAGADVVLDFGFWSRLSRDKARTAAAKAGGNALVYWVQCDDDVALQSLIARNQSSDPISFHLDEGAYAALRAKYEAPEPDEDVIAVRR